MLAHERIRNAMPLHLEAERTEQRRGFIGVTRAVPRRIVGRDADQSLQERDGAGKVVVAVGHGEARFRTMV